MDKAAHAAFGIECENTACRYLQHQGLVLLARNFKVKGGEIDLIMRDKADIVFVEVRGKHRTEYGNALESVTPGKIKKIIHTARVWLQNKGTLYRVNSRFDIVAIHPIGGKMQLDWLKNAFTVDQF